MNKAQASLMKRMAAKVLASAIRRSVVLGKRADHEAGNKRAATLRSSERNVSGIAKAFRVILTAVRASKAGTFR